MSGKCRIRLRKTVLSVTMGKLAKPLPLSLDLYMKAPVSNCGDTTYLMGMVKGDLIVIRNVAQFKCIQCSITISIL